MSKCPNGCCTYTTGAWTHSRMSGDILLAANFCPRDGTRLNADGTADAGGEAWADVLPTGAGEACMVNYKPAERGPEGVT